VVDPDAFLVLPEHIAEDKEKNKHIASTWKGIGPAYEAKVGRRGTKVRDYIRDNNPIIVALKELGIQFKYVLELQKEFVNSKLLFEGSQSILLTIASGTYPYVSSGDSEISGIISSGFGFAMPEKIVGVSKACYITKSGAGPMPTEMPKEEADVIRGKGFEIGATTGRPRRIGYLDLPALSFACKRGNINSLVLTKLDIYNGVEAIKVAVYYDKMIYSGSDFEGAKPSYTELPGWKDCKDPKQVAHYIRFIEEYVGVKVEYITTGVGEKDIIKI
jgi:adenylosuccinate synthase